MGRPTREQADQRHEQLLDSAQAVFLDKGFEQTTMENIAALVGMTKRTVHARHADKGEMGSEQPSKLAHVPQPRRRRRDPQYGARAGGG